LAKKPEVMGLYDVDYTDVGQQLLPPDKRWPRMSAWVKAILIPVQYLRDLVLGVYRLGSTDLQYAGAVTYAKGDRVVFRYAVYESLVDGNTGNDPLNTTYWVKVVDNFIGVNERVLYNGHTLILTYALNKYFGTTFRQPNDVSDIYLVNNAKPVAPFVSGATEAESSVTYANTSSEFVINAYDFDGYENLTIMVPVAVFNALDPDPSNREKIIRNFADRYIVAGITYNVETY
jgi:hypothetical protein